MRDLPLPTFPIADIGANTPPRRSLHRRESPGSAATGDQARLDVVWARDEEDIRQAQRLRHRVFVEEMGARLSVPKGTPGGYDVDMFDPFCEHLLVRASNVEGEAGPVIGTYRVLTPAAARRVGGLYSETEFDLTRLRPLRAHMVELGRSCVHPDWRSGGATAATSRPACGTSCDKPTWRRLNGASSHACRCQWKNCNMTWTCRHPH